MANEPNITLSIFELLGGVSLFLFGIKRVTKSLEDLAGASLKLIITQLTTSKLRGFLLGLIIALSLQSSGAVMLMLVAFSNTGLLALHEAINIMLGAGVGSTLTVQLLAFRIHEWAPAMLVVGFIIGRTAKGRGAEAGKALFAFGLVFLGMNLLSIGTAPLVNEDFFPAAIDFFRRTPLFAAVLAAILTMLFQSSAAMLGLLLTLAFNGMLDVQSAIPFIVGANIGSCGIAFLGASGGKPAGHRIAMAELQSRFAAGIIVLALAKYYSDIAVFLSDSPARQIAHLHTMFALTGTIVFLPFSGLLTKITKRIVPDTSEKEAFGPIYIVPNALSNPPVALGSAAREVLREGDIVLSMLDDILTALKNSDRQLLEEIVNRDDKVDELHNAVVQYLTKLTESELSEDESVTELQLLTFALELEHIADVISKDIARHVEKRLDKGYYFSDEGWKEITEFHGKVRTLVRTGLDAIPLRDKELARNIIEETKGLVESQRILTRSHIERLHAGTRFTAETSAIHLDLMADLSRIAIHVSYIAYAILGNV